MDFGEVVDFGDVHEVLKRGVGRIEIIGPSIVKIGWVSWSDNDPQRRLVAIDIWDYAELMEVLANFSAQLTEAIREATADKGEDMRISSH